MIGRALLVTLAVMGSSATALNRNSTCTVDLRAESPRSTWIWKPVLGTSGTVTTTTRFIDLSYSEDGMFHYVLNRRSEISLISKTRQLDFTAQQLSDDLGLTSPIPSSAALQPAGWIGNQLVVTVDQRASAAGFPGFAVESSVVVSIDATTGTTRALPSQLARPRAVAVLSDGDTPVLVLVSPGAGNQEYRKVEEVSLLDSRTGTEKRVLTGRNVTVEPSGVSAEALLLALFVPDLDRSIGQLSLILLNAGGDAREIDTFPHGWAYENVGRGLVPNAGYAIGQDGSTVVATQGDGLLRLYSGGSVRSIRLPRRFRESFEPTIVRSTAAGFLVKSGQAVALVTNRRKVYTTTAPRDFVGVPARVACNAL